MRKIFWFWWLCCKRAGSGNFSFANDWQWIFGFPALAFFLFILGSILGHGSMTIPADTWWWAVLTAGLAFALTWIIRFLIRLLIEPAKLYYKEKERADALEHALKPKVKIIGPDILTSPKGATGRAMRRIRIIVENDSISHLKNCSVRESEFVNRHGHRSGMQRYFRLAEESYATSDHSFKKTFDLRGKGDRQIIDIASLDEKQEDSRILMHYATDPTAPTLNSIPRSFFPHLLTVSFTADDTFTAERRVYRLSISDDGILEMNSVEEDKDVER